MGMLIDGQWSDAAIRRRSGPRTGLHAGRQRLPRPHHQGRFVALTRPSPAAIISTSPTIARGRTAP